MNWTLLLAIAFSVAILTSLLSALLQVPVSFRSFLAAGLAGGLVHVGAEYALKQRVFQNLDIPVLAKRMRRRMRR